MAELTEKLVRPQQKRLQQQLKHAYADEWFAHYNFWFVANTISGPSSSALRRVVADEADRALTRANRLAARLRQLGGEPIPKLNELSDHGTNKPFKLPADVRDTDGMLKAVLDAERTSIRTYEEILGHIGTGDPVTAKLMTGFLSEAMAGEDEIQRLLGGPASEMTGR